MKNWVIKENVVYAPFGWEITRFLLSKLVLKETLLLMFPVWKSINMYALCKNEGFIDFMLKYVEVYVLRSFY